MRASPVIRDALPDEAGILLELQKRTFLVEAIRYNDMSIAPLHQTLEQLLRDIESMCVLVALVDGVVVGSVRGHVQEGVGSIGRFMVHSGYQNRGIGAQLLEALEHRLAEATVFELLTGGRSQKNLSFYGARGYRVVAQEGILVTMRKVAYAK